MPPPVPQFVVLVAGDAQDRQKIGLVAVRSGVPTENVERAFANGRSWVVAGGSAGTAARAVGLGERLGWAVRSVQTSAPMPSFLPAMVLGGVAQTPIWLSTGLPVVDTALAAGLGITALASAIRQGRRIGPARQATAAHAAWAELHRAPRVERPSDALLRAEAALGLPAVPANVRGDGYEALGEAWFVVLSVGTADRERDAIAAAENLGVALASDEQQLLAAITRLRRLAT